MDRAVMRAAQRDRELIAGPAAERTRLQVAKMMRVGWPSTADEAWLFCDIAKVLPIAIAAGGGDGGGAPFVFPPRGGGGGGGRSPHFLGLPPAHHRRLFLKRAFQQRRG